VPDVLIIADTFRSPELRHEVPAPVPDPFLYAEVGGARHVMVSTHEVPIIAAAGEYTFHAPEEYGVEELRRTMSSYDAMFQELVVRAARSLGIERAVVPDTFPVYAADALRSAGVVLETDRDLFGARRRAKSAAELAGIRRAQAAADAGMAAARALLASSEPGADGVLQTGGEPLTSERLHAAIAAAFVANDASAHVFIASHGAQTAIGHHLGEGPIRAGEPVIVDIWPRDNRSACFTDMTRTFVKGEPPAEVVEWHRLCVDWLGHALGLIRPGVTAKSVYDGVCEQVEAAGFPTQRTKAEGEVLESGFIFSLGHGVGLEVHEEPTLGLLGHTELVPGDVLAVEPDLCRAGDYGVRVEDLVLVTDDGCERLGSFAYDLIVQPGTGTLS
jgi:Xaa-Pro aminopeptidase